MEVHRDLSGIGGWPFPILTLGNFDGLHLGHQAIFSRLVQRSREVGGTSVVFTFDPHPVRVLFPDRPLFLLSSLEQKLHLFEHVGIEAVVCVRFTAEFARQSPEEFVKHVLVQRLGVKELFVGEDFRFGMDKRGDIAFLTLLGERYGFQVHVVEPCMLGGRRVSSTDIRRLIQEGEVGEARHLLGRPYSLVGKVVGGYRQGREIGFPTANVEYGEQLLPQAGVYAVLVDCQGKTLPGVVNVGLNPTFGRERLSVEVHLLDFSGELYGEVIELRFLQRLRGEQTFPSITALARQIERDIAQARDILQRERS